MHPIHFESYILWFLVSSSILIHATTGVDSYSTDEKRFNSKEKRNGEENKIFLWKIERNTPSYLFGTMHVPYFQVWDPIQDEVMKVFNISQELFLEIDMELQQNKRELAKCVLLPNGGMVSDIVTPGVHTKLQNYLAYLRNKIDNWLAQEKKDEKFTADKIYNNIFNNWERKRLIWTMNAMLDVTKDSIKFIEYDSMDNHLYQLAKMQGKSVGSVENVIDVCNIFNDVSSEHLLFFITELLELQHDAILDVSTRWKVNMRSEYQTGNLSSGTLFQNSRYFTQYLEDTRTLDDDSIIFGRRSNQVKEHPEVEELTSYFRTNLILERNENMANKVIQILDDNPNTSFFFAFGAGHFIGNNGIVNIMKRRGYKVTRLPESPTHINTMDVSQETASYSTQNVDSGTMKSCVENYMLLRYINIFVFSLLFITFMNK